MNTRFQTYHCLQSKDDWYHWLRSVNTLAHSYDVWEYCDPNGSEQAPADEDTHEGLQEVRELIMNTVDNEHQFQSSGICTTRGMIQTLQIAFQPTPYEHKNKVHQQYLVLREGPKQAKVDEYFSQWLNLFYDSKELSPAILSEHDICEGFIEASRHSNPFFYIMMIMRKQDNREMRKLGDILRLLLDIRISELKSSTMQDKNKITQLASLTSASKTLDELEGSRDNLKIHKCLLLYRDFLPKQSPAQIFAAYGLSFGEMQHDDSQNTNSNTDNLQNPAAEIYSSGRTTPENNTKSKEEKLRRRQALRKERLCICGNRHSYVVCFYLNAASAPEEWKKNRAVQAKMITKLREDLQVCDNIERDLRKSSIPLPQWWPHSNR